MNVALIVFNRPRQTEQVFQRIAAARPERLFVISDGPRPEVAGEAAKVAEARRATEAVEWPCVVQRHYADTNLGCGVRPATGISWVFEHVEDCMILEDDCIPDPTFFRFCAELLERYRHDERVMTISGDQFVRRPRFAASYGFSRFPLTWGWATWRRAWRHFDYTIASWPERRATAWLRDLLRNDRAAWYWSARFNYAQGGCRRDIWDIQWIFATWLHDGVCIYPAVNLVTNVGFGEDSTHTKGEPGFADVGTVPVRFPLVHPDTVSLDSRYDNALFETAICPPPSLIEVLTCRYTYGAWIRRLPGVGALWTRWRDYAGGGRVRDSQTSLDAGDQHGG